MPTNPQADLYWTLRLDPAAPSPVLAGQVDQLLAQAAGDRAYLELARAILGDPARKQFYDARRADPTAPPLNMAELSRIAAQPAAMTAPLPAAAPSATRLSTTALGIGAGALALVLVLVVGIIVAVGSGSSSSAKCSDVVFIGAAGSDQRKDPNQNGGVGPQVYQTWLNLQADAAAAGLTAELRPVEYPADKVPFFEAAKTAWTMITGGGYDPSLLEPYFESVAAGADAATAEIKDALTCDGSKIVIAGYSQGAMALHRALHRVGPDPAIVSGALIGDGDRLPQAQDPYLTTYQASDTPMLFGGIAQYDKFVSLSGASPEPFPRAWQGRLFSACVDGDPVCSFTFFSVNETDEFGAHLNYDPASWRSFLQEGLSR